MTAHGFAPIWHWTPLAWAGVGILALVVFLAVAFVVRSQEKGGRR